MKHIASTFLKGLFTLLPLIISVYIFVWFLNWVESFSGTVLLTILPEFLYLPGMGVVMACLLIYGVGSVMDRPLARGLFGFVESLFSELPVVKTVYLTIKDFTEFLKPNPGRKHNQVVLVKFPGGQVEMIGLMTRESLRDLPEAVSKTDRVAVYFPMSYQMGGCTMFIPKAWVHPTNLSVEAAMRSIITAWLPGHDKNVEVV